MGPPGDSSPGVVVGQLYCGGATVNAPTTAVVSITLHIVGTWTADSYDPYPIPAPTSVLLQETSAAGAGGTNGANQPFPGKADDGCGQSGPNSVSTPASGQYTQIPVQNGTITLDRVLSASMTATPNPPTNSGPPNYQYKPGMSSGGAGVGPYTLNASPPTIGLSGAAYDTTGNANILVGQHCTASLIGVPSIPGATVAYTWSVSGPTYQDWQAQTPANGTTTFNSEASYYADGPGILTNPTAQWQWVEVGNGTSKSETVSVSAKVTPPAGQGSAFTVTATQPVSVWSPTWTCTGTGGEIDVNNYYEGASGYCLYCGPTPQGKVSGYPSGMTWYATVSAPPAPVPLGSGSLRIVQLVTSLDIVYEEDTAIPTIWQQHESPNNGKTGLDTSWPYPWVVPASPYMSGDSPGIQLDTNKSAIYNMSLKDYLMYLPPGSGRYVPLANFIWSVNMAATIPNTNNWRDYTGSPGTVTDSGGQQGKFLRSSDFPMWTQIFTFSPF